MSKNSGKESELDTKMNMTIIRTAATSSVEAAHEGPVTDLQWLPGGKEISQGLGVAICVSFCVCVFCFCLFPRMSDCQCMSLCIFIYLLASTCVLASVHHWLSLYHLVCAGKMYVSHLSE